MAKRRISTEQKKPSFFKKNKTAILISGGVLLAGGLTLVIVRATRPKNNTGAFQPNQASASSLPAQQFSSGGGGSSSSFVPATSSGGGGSSAGFPIQKSLNYNANLQRLQQAMLSSIHYGNTPEVQNMRNRGGADGKWGDATSQALRRVYNFTGTVITEQQFNNFLKNIY